MSHQYGYLLSGIVPNYAWLVTAMVSLLLGTALPRSWLSIHGIFNERFETRSVTLEAGPGSEDHVALDWMNHEVDEKCISPQRNEESQNPSWFHNRLLYTVGWICALPLEAAAARGMLDEEYGSQNITQPQHDTNTYTLGRVAAHNVVIASLPANGYGSANASAVATHMRRTFPSIQIVLLVGVGGGVPWSTDLRLGDVVVSSGVVQYDLGKVTKGAQFYRTGTMRSPDTAIMTAVSALQAKHEQERTQVSRLVDEMVQQNPQMADYAYPGTSADRLFRSDYEHEEASGEDCATCDKSNMVERPKRRDTVPRIYYETIGSASQVMKHGKTRDALAEIFGTRCLEMEAAGVTANSYLVVRGISDYADSHKNDLWQRYAAATAAAYAKEFLSILPVKELERNVQPPKRLRSPVRVHKAKCVKAGPRGKQMFLSDKHVFDVQDVETDADGLQVFGSIPGQVLLAAIKQQAGKEAVSVKKGNTASGYARGM